MAILRLGTRTQIDAVQQLVARCNDNRILRYSSCRAGTVINLIGIV